jgi:hypothetical protein
MEKRPRRVYRPPIAQLRNSSAVRLTMGRTNQKMNDLTIQSNLDKVTGPSKLNADPLADRLISFNSQYERFLGKNLGNVADPDKPLGEVIKFSPDAAS